MTQQVIILPVLAALRPRRRWLRESPLWVLSKDGNLARATLVSKLNENCDKVGPLSYTGTPPLTRNDYYGYGRLNAKLAVNATAADTTAPSFALAQAINHRAVDVTFNEPMGEGSEDPTKYQITAGQGTLSSSPNKVLRILPTVYRLIWNSGDMVETGTVTIKVLSGVKDVAGNLVPANVTQNTAGTKRIIAVNCGNNYGPDLDGYVLLYAPPFNSDNGFQANEQAVYLTSSAARGFVTAAIDRSGVANPAPEAVYQTIRLHWGDPSPFSISYSVPVSPGNKTARLHFAETYFSLVGEQVFDIKINGTLVYDNFDILAQTGGVQNKAYILEVPNVAHAGFINVELVSQQGATGLYNVAINGIEIVKP